MPDLLLELGTEELPARFVDRALAALREGVAKTLGEAALAPQRIEAGGTPRRLAVWAGGLAERQPDRTEERAGPAAEGAFKDGQPTTAAIKFAESLGLSVDQLEVRPVKKGKKVREHLYGVRRIPGRPALEVLAELIPGWIDAIPFAKSMRWVPGSRVRFGRPLRRITALLGDGVGAEVVPVEWGGVRSGRQVEGHRFLHDEPLTLDLARWDDYVTRLRELNVLVDPAERRARVEEGLAEHLEPATLQRRAKLVSEVVNLVEWPVVDAGAFDERFLRLPEVVIEEAMTGHQRYFPIRRGGRLQPSFAYVANRPLHPVIREGNERVLAARLSDALFFFEQDQKRPLAERVDDLGAITFMAELGSLAERVDRVAAVALEVAKAAGWISEDAQLPGAGARVTRSFGRGGELAWQLEQAARLARADLTTDVVGEFPELQGEMGAIYAGLQGQPEEVAVAIREHYLPRGETDELPQSKVGICLAVADKLDTIVAAWATGKRPTGSKDPFMVRRGAIGVLRILRERGLDCGYARLVRAALAQLPEALRQEAAEGELVAYFRDRLEVMAIKDAGRRHDLVRAALDAGRDPTNVVDFWERLDALDALAADERFGPLCELVERTQTITEKNGAGVDPADVDRSRLDHPAERALFEAIEGCRADVRRAIEERRYVDAGRRYVEALAGVTHTFFEPAPAGVFVMDEDPRLRTNRLALLKQVHGLLAGFADLAEVVKGKGR